MIITEIQYFFSKIIRFQAIFKDTVEFTCALEFKISSQLKNAENMRFAGIFLCMFLFLFQGFGLVDIDTGHEPVKLSPGQISDLRVFPRPLVSAMHCQLFIDQYKTICIAVQGLDKALIRSRRLPQNRNRELDAGSSFSCSSTTAQSPSIDLRISV